MKHRHKMVRTRQFLDRLVSIDMTSNPPSPRMLILVPDYSKFRDGMCCVTCGYFEERS